MSTRSPSCTMTAGLVAGAVFGSLDAFTTLASQPYPGSPAFLLGYGIGPVLLGLAWGGVMGGGAAWGWRAVRQETDSPATVPVVAVGLTWCAAIVLAGWREGQGRGELAICGAASGIAAVAFGRLARDAALRFVVWSSRRRRLFAGAAAAGIAASVAFVAPAGLGAFRAGTGPCPSGDVPKAEGRPNILLLSVDTLRVDAAERMVSYRRLAARGIEFRQQMTTSPWTIPSVASMLTGTPWEVHRAGLSLSSRVLTAKTPLSAATPSLAERLGAAGYHTHAVVTNPFLAPHYGFDRGFCSYENVTMWAESARGLSHATVVRLARALAPSLLPSDRADEVRRRAERWLDRSDARRPFFLWVHVLDPHAPYGDREGASTSLTLELMAVQQGHGLAVPFREMGSLRGGQYRPAAAEREQIADLYRADVAFADGQITRFLDFLEARGLLSTTAVIFTSDHGEEFWEHGGVEHGSTLHEEVLRVPLVIASPAPPTAARVRQSLTSVTDLAPTILALAGIADTALPGENLLASEPATAPERTLVLGNLLFGQEWRGVRTPRFKYLRSEHGEEQLYDLVRDPEERVNQVAGLRQELRVARGRLPDDVWLPALVTEAALEGPVRDAMRRLGYR